MTHLLRGNTKSCGKASCREKHGTRVERKRAPNGSRVLTLEQIQKAWACYHSTDTSKQRSIPQLATRHRVRTSTLNDIFRTVRDVGGIDDYTALVTKE